MKGKLFVIDGTDGSGKTVQFQHLYHRLEQEGFQVGQLDFPRYGQPSAYFVEKMLNGNYGTLEELDAYKSSLFYSLDRFDASFEIKKQLEAGKILISNRYTSASMGHQGGKIADSAKRREFLTWLEHLEYDILGIPRPDAIFYLNVPYEIASALIDQKNEREYLKGGKKRDIHESNLAHLKNAQKVFEQCCDIFLNWERIPCINSEGDLDGIENIHEKLYEKVMEHIEK